MDKNKINGGGAMIHLINPNNESADWLMEKISELHLSFQYECIKEGDNAVRVEILTKDWDDFKYKLKAIAQARNNQGHSLVYGANGVPKIDGYTKDAYYIKIEVDE